jgi:hypothetical protein
MKQLQILDMDALAFSAEHLAVPARHPEPGSGDVQIPDLALGPAVNTGGLVTTPMTDGLEPLIGLHADMRVYRHWIDSLFYNFDSTKGEIWCYAESGHRRPPLDIDCCRKQTNTLGDTGCPFYSKSQHFPLLCSN